MKNKNQNSIPRPPIVVVMGHIDHGKSKLLDYIRNANIVEKEAGGITQHIGAYEAEVKCDVSHEHKTRKITFLDTPGHEAFSQMRLRGTKVADVAILVIAADEGVKPQTLEAYEAIKNAGIPFVVALNKIDKPNADPERIKNQLAENQIFIEGYGGNIPSVNISAKTGEGVDELLDIVLLLTEMENLRANPKENASGIVIESKLGSRRGISATLIVQNGVMRKGMFVISRNSLAPVRIFEDFQGKSLDEATFSSPVRIIGFDNMPSVGAEFKTFKTKKEAEEAVNVWRLNLQTEIQSPNIPKLGGEKTIIPLVIKGDVMGSVEALEHEIKKLENEEVSLNILRKDTGKITEDDIRLASSAKNPIVLGFNVPVDSPARTLAERFEVFIYTSDIIYKISEWLGEEIEKRKSKAITEKIVGSAKILKIFSKEKNKQLVGGEVLEGKIIMNKYFVRIKRNDAEIGEGKIVELQHNKLAAKEVNQGEQFGMIMDSKTEIAKGDAIEIIEKLQ
ncbi:translation initiation factor IF-2 [Patescibacteria group bacterium]|nr:translation initiation factor IF-2 [Patescibacteria group bacterium]